MADKPVDKNRLSFKDFHTTEYRPGEDEHTNYRAYRRKRTNESLGAAVGGASAMQSYINRNRPVSTRNRDDDERRRKERDSESDTVKKASKPAKQKKQYRYLLHISDRPFTKAQKRDAEKHHKRVVAARAERKASEKAAAAEKERLANRPVHQKAIDAVKGGLGKIFGKKEESEYSLDDILSILERYKAQSFSNKRKAALRMKVGKTKHKARLGKRKAMRRMASQAVLKRRSRRQEWRNAFKKLSRGKKKSDMSIAQIQSIEKKLERPVWQRIVNRKQVIGVKDKRRLEIARKKGTWKK